MPKEGGNRKKAKSFSKTFGKSLDKTTPVMYNNTRPMREWRNWQTRTFEGRVDFSVRVQVPFLAPTKRGCPCGIPSLFMQAPRRRTSAKRRALVRKESCTSEKVNLTLPSVQDLFNRPVSRRGKSRYPKGCLLLFMQASRRRTSAKRRALVRKEFCTSEKVKPTLPLVSTKLQGASC